MDCKKTQIIFLIASLILKRKAVVGNIVDLDKIKEFCDICDVDYIKEVLDCFVDAGLLMKHDTYICKDGGHHFIPNENDLKDGYICDQCCASGKSEDECYIPPDDLQKCFVKSTYRVRDDIDEDIWEARAFYMMGDIEKAVALIMQRIDTKSNDPKTIAEKIAPYFSVFGASATLADKLTPFIKMMM